MKIVVLCGGTSSEREVSINSSVKVAKALAGRGHEVALVDVFFGLEEEISFGSQDFSEAADEYRALSGVLTDELKASRPFFGSNVIEMCRKADITFLGLHGANGEDGKIQAAFDLLGIKYTGSGYLGSAIGMSKAFTKNTVGTRIPMPGGIIVTKNDPFASRVAAPCVIKPSNGGSSLGVEIITDDADYDAALLKALEFDDTVLVEEFIDGRELTQGVLNGVALPPVEIIPNEGFYDYTKKYNGQTREVCPAENLSDEVLEKMSEYAVLMGRILGLSVYYRVDFRLNSKGELYCLEANTLPGMTDTSLVPQEAAAVGIDYPTLCEKIIEYSLEKYN